MCPNSVTDQLCGFEHRNLRHNSLSGDIPLALGTLIDLQVLDLAENKLEGPIPESFSNLTSLSYL